MKSIALVITCEHAVDTVPAFYEQYFTNYQSLLATHRGIDFGALAIALRLSHAFGCPLVSAHVTRLLIDCNRSLTNAHCFSEVSASFSPAEKNQLINTYYLPFRQQAIDYINTSLIGGHQVWHLSIHSFTPDLNGQTRSTDIGLLYDPKRPSEKIIAYKWQRLLKKHGKYRRIRMNYPYKGTADGFTTTLRKQFDDDDYVGIEVESNQLLTCEPHSLAMVADVLCVTLTMLINEFMT